MKTTLDLVDVIWTHIEGSSLDIAITGGIYKNKRPVNSNLEDVVINSLPITNEQLQQAVVNVNVFVPDEQHKINDIEQRMANWGRLKALGRLAVDVLQDNISGDYTWDVQQQNTIEDEESGQYFVNIRVQFYISNI